MKHSVIHVLALIVALLMAVSLVAIAEEGLSVGEQEEVEAEIEEQYYEEEMDFGDYTVVESADTVTTGTPTVAEGLTYTGEAQALLNVAGVAEGVMVYALDGGEFSSEIPTATDAGTYSVSYRLVDGEEVTTLTVTIGMAEIQFIPPVANTEADVLNEAAEAFEADVDEEVEGDITPDPVDEMGEQDDVWL